ncbi:uncharacterized protein LOC127811688 [Diospyros lotus]|uniref:uncharacterized protein LOC127811688 n=1 Tax=Diospyros lotus TaxID=55363 RepID=UPI002257B58D|nr:uncharacterized protein LOC127811688 [Diospyros lotus]XP_052207746.1 uncharacterized protein LOC127811688 [Diospyros lotus]XP_052207747.1 uncharacterized protein LOC127811688 [Diospyros lotus]
MDLTFKGKTWVGNIYQKFESMCHEVDNLVNKDTVLYVENQVQTVGGSVKRFCSDVVQDFLPLVESGKDGAQLVSLKQCNTVDDCNRSMVKEKPVYQSSVGQHPPVHSIKYIDEQFIHPPSYEHIEVEESDVSLGLELDYQKDKKSDIVHEKNHSDKLVDKNSNVEENDKMEEPIDKMPKITVDENDVEEMINERPDIVVEENDLKGEASWLEELELVCPENKDFYEASVSSEYIDEKNEIMAKIPHATLACHTHKDNVLCDGCVFDISSMLPPSKMDSSAVSHENKKPEVQFISSCSSLSTDTYSTSELLNTNIPWNYENMCYNPVNSINGDSYLSDASQPFPILSCDNKIVDVELAFSSSALSLDTKDVNTLTDNAASLAGSSGNRSGHYYECTLVESSLKIGEASDCRVDVADPSLETIDLSEKVKPDESCVLVDSKLFLSYRAQKHRSYKKLLKDAFAYRRRLGKEYEQLAIMYGDIDIDIDFGGGEQPMQNPSPVTPTAKAPLGSRRSSHDLCDLEWELL